MYGCSHFVFFSLYQKSTGGFIRKKMCYRIFCILRTRGWPYQHADQFGITGAFFNRMNLFNLNPIRGRTFSDGEDLPGAPKLAVINEKMWRERLNGDANLTEKKLILNGEAYSVIGVVTASFKHPLDPDVEVWLPVANFPGNTNQRNERFLFAMGHLKPYAPIACMIRTYA